MVRVESRGYHRAMLSHPRWHAPTLVAIIALLTTAPAVGQRPTPTKIVGCVMDDSFSTWSGIEIAAEGADGRRTVVTHVDGCYDLAGVTPGKYALSVQHPLFIPQTRDVSVDGQPTLIFDFVLTFKPSVVREPPLLVLGGPNADPTIDVCVTAGSGEPVAGAVVTGLRTSVVTDQDGCVRVAVRPGEYRLRAREDGRESPEVGPIVVAAGDRRRCPVLVLDRREP